jgi:hypothetical protein
VVGVLSRACHLAVESPDGERLVLSAPEVPLAPNGIAVRILPEVSMARAGFRAGQAVALGPAGPADPDADWRVMLGGAPTWEPRPTTRSVIPGELAARLRHTRTAVVADGAGGSLLPLLWAAEAAAGTPPTAAVRLACVPARQLCAAAIRGDVRAVAAAAGRLAGLGPGLTPSGDDLLAGFAAAWTLMDESLGLQGGSRRGVTGALVSGARAGASPLGRAWLGHAVRGELAEPMRRFADALFAEDARDLGPALREVLGVGASSGTDWAVGFLLGAGAVLDLAAGISR